MKKTVTILMMLMTIAIFSQEKQSQDEQAKFIFEWLDDLENKDELITITRDLLKTLVFCTYVDGYCADDNDLKPLILTTKMLDNYMEQLIQIDKERKQNRSTASFKERFRMTVKNARISFFESDEWKKHKDQVTLDSIKIANQIIKPLQKTSAFKQ